MDESEKMVALKKAYAEIILNTAKEAAARVMASERKALRFQHDLKAAKDESLRMLLRVKQMLDAKTTEADINYISQRRRIEELEAQLEEAEDKILELRVELRNASEELEQQKKNELQVQVGKPTENAVVTSKDEMLHDHLNNLEPIVPYSSDSERETALSSDAVHKCLNSTKETRQLAFSHCQSYYSHGSDIASIIMRSTEAELSRNGCTQRVRAFERQQLDGTLPTKLASHKCITATNELKPKGSDKDGRKSILPFPQSNNVVRPKKMSRQEPKEEEKKLREESANRRRLWRRQIRKTRTLVRKEKAKERARENRSKELEESNSARSSSVQLIKSSQASSAVADHNLCSETDDVKVGECVNAGARNNKMEVYPSELPEKLSGSFSKFIESNIPIGKRKRSATRRKCLGISAGSSAHQLGMTCQPPDTSHYETNSVDAQDVSGDCYSKGNEEKVDMRSTPRLDPLLLLSNSMEEDRIQLKMDTPTKVEGQELSGASESKRQQDSDVADIPSTPPGKVDNGMTDVPVTISQGPVEAKESRLVRYTFQRKRKKEPLSYPDEDVALDQGNLKRCSMERDQNVEESNKCSLIDDSSRDSRRLAQVARQLISLSGKKW